MDSASFGINPGEIYFDSAATTLKPKVVCDAVLLYYSKECASVHRSLYARGAKATEQYEEARVKVQQFIHAPSSDEVVFVKSATEGLNLLAYSLTDFCLKKGDEVIVSVAEHHSNFVPWQEACRRVGAKFTVIGLDDDFTLNLKELEDAISSKTKIVALNHISNVLGVKNPIKKVSQICKKVGAYLVVDGAQSVSHENIDVQDLEADFFVFSGHKMYGPTGVGVLWGRKDLLNSMRPFHFGGSMVEEVTNDISTYQMAPQKFEAGTPAIASVLGLSKAIDFIEKNRASLKEQKELVLYAIDKLKSAFKGEIEIFGGQNTIVSFVCKNMHALDMATLLALDGICIRAGNHCAAPLLTYLGQTSILRFSFGIYNTRDEIDRVILKMQKTLLEIHCHTT